MAMKRPAQKTPTISPELAAMRDADRKIVRGKFMFHEVPGGKMEFSFLKYPGDDIKNFSMVDGEIYSVPLGVAKHLNTNCWYPTYDYKSDEQGRPVMKMGQKVRRCSFANLEFEEIQGLKTVSPLFNGIEAVKE